MQNRKAIIILATIITFGVFIRIILPLDNVFSGGFLNFPAADSYLHADKMRQILTGYPHMLQGTFIYDWCVVGVAWLIGLGQPSIKLLEITAMVTPLLLTAGIIFLVYLIGMRVFNRVVGLAAAFIVAIIPGELLNRTIFGTIDHHVAEIFLTTLAAACVIYAVTQIKFFTWQAALCGVIMIIALALYRYTWIGFAAVVDNPVSALRSLDTPHVDMIRTTTTEAVPLVFGVGNVWPMLHLIMVATGIVVIIKSASSWCTGLIIAWAVFMMVATVWQLRFDYYLVIPASLMGGICIVKLYQAAPGKYFELQKALAILVVFIIVLFTLPVYIGMARSDLNTPSDDWNETLEWIKNNTPEDSIIIAWWDYGYWIRYRADRTAVLVPEHRDIPIVGRAFLSYNNVVDLPEGTDYIIIDKDTAFNFTKAMSIRSGLDYGSIDDDKTLVGRLYSGQSVEGFIYVYGDTVKVYEYQ